MDIAIKNRQIAFVLKHKGACPVSNCCTCCFDRFCFVEYDTTKSISSYSLLKHAQEMQFENVLKNFL